MKSIYILIVLFLSLGVISCKKEHSITIQAQDYITGDGSAYAGMSFSVIQSRPGYPEDKIKTVYEGVLDNNGHASFDLKMHRDWVYVLSVSQPDNICYGGAVVHYLDNESSNTVNFEYAHCAYSKLILNNVACVGPEDKLVLYQSDDLENIDSDFGWEHDGCVYWETAGGSNGDPIGYSSIYYGNIYYKWVVTKNSVTNTYYDTVYYPAGEFTTYQIDY